MSSIQPRAYSLSGSSAWAPRLRFGGIEQAAAQKLAKNADTFDMLLDRRDIKDSLKASLDSMSATDMVDELDKLAQDVQNHRQGLKADRIGTLGTQYHPQVVLQTVEGALRERIHALRTGNDGVLAAARQVRDIKNAIESKQHYVIGLENPVFKTLQSTYESLLVLFNAGRE